MNREPADPAPETKCMHAAETTGFPCGNRHHVLVSEGIAGRPLSLAWITDELLEYTRAVWSRAYGHEVSENEAIEILVNVKRLAEFMYKAAEKKGVCKR